MSRNRSDEPVPPPRNAPLPFRIDESIGFLVSRVKASIMAGLDARLAASGHDLTAAQWAILLRIAYDGVKTAADLCREGYDTGSMTRMLGRLQEKGFIERVRSSSDRRVFELALTPVGRALFPELAELGRGILIQHLAGFGDGEVEQLRALLRRMLDNGRAG